MYTGLTQGSRNLFLFHFLLIASVPVTLNLTSGEPEDWRGAPHLRDAKRSRAREGRACVDALIQRAISFQVAGPVRLGEGRLSRGLAARSNALSGAAACPTAAWSRCGTPLLFAECVRARVRADGRVCVRVLVCVFRGDG